MANPAECEFDVTKLKPYPPCKDPLAEDYFHMGTQLSKDVMMLHANHPKENADYFILVHIPTGKRIMIEPPKPKEAFDV